MRRLRSMLVPLLMVALPLVLVAGCPGDWTGLETGNPSPGTVRALTLVHAGVDFSLGLTGTPTADIENSDGETIGWPPLPNNWRMTDTEVWFRPAANTAEDSFSKDMGAVALRSVTTVPDTWDGGVGLELAALQVGHVYVVKCRDGYAKFLVKAIRVESAWEVDVEYVFTSGLTFPD
ncbi:MAG: hypothetical protein IPM18_00545 [Phycisphaerales bacterium]|nr:hypothetical protein [Phycisphaerales bacterium]